MTPQQILMSMFQALQVRYQSAYSAYILAQTNEQRTVAQTSMDAYTFMMNMITDNLNRLAS